MSNDNLHGAKRAKNDEFYTQFRDINDELQQYRLRDPDVFRGKTILLPCDDDPEWSNFTKFFTSVFVEWGIKKVISTSYNPGGKGKVFTLDGDTTGDGKVTAEDLTWEYLEGDGDFRSPEVGKLLEEADFVITNPPFSLFREFLAWVVAAGKKFLLLGNMNAITYKEVWPLIQADEMWYGPSISSGDREFRVPDSYPLEAAGCRVDVEGNKFIRVKGVRWFTNLDHGKRHEPLMLLTEKESLQYILNQPEFEKYDNYDAIEVPKAKAIPSDYEGVMGVPISFLDKYCPEQFEIVGCSYDYGRPEGWPEDVSMSPVIEGRNIYKRIFIKHINPSK